MTAPDNLLNGYLAYAEASVHHRQDQDYWAMEQMDRAIHVAPDFAWEAVTQLVERASDDQTLAFIAAGPLEDLICNHPAAVIERVERRAAENPRFRKALRAVWGGNRMPALTRARIDAAVVNEPPW